MLSGLLCAPAAQQETCGMTRLTALRLDMSRGGDPLAQSLGSPPLFRCSHTLVVKIKVFAECWALWFGTFLGAMSQHLRHRLVNGQFGAVQLAVKHWARLL